jgi:hypothetical protein
MKRALAFSAIPLALSLTVSAQAAVSVDFEVETGKLRPELHSAGFGPQICSCPPAVIADIRSMGFKASRTHDWALLNSNQRVCDWHHIFPLPHLDAKDPANYVFGPTDYLFKRTREELGHEIFFRLGTSIEHSGTTIHFNSLIPEDFDKVAEAFAGTIRHYNRGWANGHEWGIKYWEIWNEPDGQNNMWCLPDGDLGKGDTPNARAADQMKREKRRLELFAKFFATCLKRIKDEFGDTVKVGGPALCTWRPSRSDRIGTEAYFRAIFSACREAGIAPDFISWHYYGNKPEEVLASVARARKFCNDEGFPKCELILDEWHYRNASWDALRSADPAVKRKAWTGPASHNGIDSSCFNLTLLSKFQTSKLDQAFYYGCKNVGSWGYKSEAGEKYKVYYGLKMFGDFLRDFPVMCASASDKAGVTVLSAKSADGSRKAVLVTDYRSKLGELSIDIKGVAPDAECEVTIHDFERNLETVKAKLEGGKLVLPKRDANSAAFLIAF